MNSKRQLGRWMGIALALAAPAWGVSPSSVTENDFTHFSQGQLESAALTSDGFLEPAYARELIGTSSSAIVWDALRERGGTVLCATGHEGRLVRVIDEKTSQTLGQPGDPELTAMVALEDGSVLVAGAPSGTIYRLDADDRLTTAAQLEATFVWRMVRDARGNVWAATGSEGRLFRLHPVDGGTLQVEEVAKLPSSNLLDLWIDTEGQMGPAGDLFVAGQDPGWVYRVGADGQKVEVAFNAQAEEVRALTPTPDGLALALNTERAPTPQALSLTLRMAGGSVTGQQPTPTPAPPGATGNGAQALAQAFAGSGGGPYGPPRSQVFLLTPQGYARLLWNAPERPIHDLRTAPGGRHLLAAAGAEGRLFEVDPADGNFSVVADLRDDYLLRMIPDGDGLLLAAARNGQVYHLAPARAREAVFLSQALDAGLPVAWGHCYVRGNLNRDRRVEVAFRYGNDGDVESEYWTDWSRDEAALDNEPVAMDGHPARFVQYRLTLKQRSGADDPLRVDTVELFYRQPNLAPMLRNFKVTDAGEGASGAAGPAANGSKAPPAPTPPGQASGAAKPSGSGRDARSNPMTLKIEWQAHDPNNDPMVYTLAFKAHDEAQWLKIDDELTQTQVPLGTGGVADGRYRFRVVASDSPGNPAGEALTAELVSDEVTIDNTPPVFEKLTVAVKGAQAAVRLELTDALSLLSSVKVDLDNGDSLPVFPADGLIDQRSERFEWQTEALKSGQHVLTVVATDTRGNSAVKKAVFTVDKGKD